jgi:TonB family protein
MSRRSLSALLAAAFFTGPLAAAPRPKTPPPLPEPAPETPKRAQRRTKRPKPKTREQWVAGYVPKVKAALAGRWADAVTARMSEFNPGNLTVSFQLDAEGTVLDVTITANTSNDAFAKFCDQFVRESKFEPPPAGALEEGRVEIPFTFTIY